MYVKKIIGVRHFKNIVLTLTRLESFFKRDDYSLYLNYLKKIMYHYSASRSAESYINRQRLILSSFFKMIINFL